MKTKLLLILSFFGFSTFGFSQKTLKVKPDQTIAPKTWDELMMPQEDFISKPKNQNRKILYADVNFKGFEPFKICLEDVDQNGSYFDFGSDMIGIAYGADTSVLISSHLTKGNYFGPGSTLKKDVIFSVDGEAFQIVKWYPKKGKLKIQHLGPNSQFKYDMILSKKLPDFQFKNDEGEVLPLSGLIDHSKDYHMVEFWSPFCPPCMEEFPDLKKLSEYSVELILICGMCDDEEAAKKILKEYDMPGIHVFATSYMEKAFNQNGFPYRMLYDKDLNLIQRIFTLNEAVNMIVK